MTRKHAIVGGSDVVDKLRDVEDDEDDEEADSDE